MGATASAVGAGILGFNPARVEPGFSGGGLFPGEGVTVWHPDATSGRTVSIEAVQTMMDRGLAALSGETDPVRALERLLPGLSAQSKVAVKINLIASPMRCWTRWEVVQALVNRLTQTLDGAFPPGNITIYDQHDLASHGYTADRFPGVVLSSENSCTSGVMIPTPGTPSELSRFITEADFLINCPVLKNHNANQFTLAMKNHYGSVNPSAWCGDYDGMLSINAAPDIKGKTALVILDGLFGTYVGGLDGGPDNWTLFPGGTPRRLFVATDPCVAEYLGQAVINEQRQVIGLTPLVDYYLYRAGSPPYELGITDPGAMNLSFVDASVVNAPTAPHPASLRLLPASPNPFTASTTWMLDVRSPQPVRAVICDLMGREVAILASRDVGSGAHPLRWDGRGAGGRLMPPGVYVLAVHGEAVRLTSPVSLLR